MQQSKPMARTAAMAAVLLALFSLPAWACTPSALAGTWKAERLAGEALAADIELTLEFSAEGRLGGRAACNRYGASYRLDGTTLHLTDPFSTRMACPPPVMAVEQRFLALLREPLACSLNAEGRLTLRGASGKLVARRVP